jgi:hypothetical protein
LADASGTVRLHAVTRPNEVPAAELEACAWGCAEWLVDATRDTDARVEIDAFSAGLTWAGDRKALEAKAERVVRVQVWLQTALRAITTRADDLPLDGMEADARCSALEHELVTRLRPAISALEGLQGLVGHLVSSHEQAHRELFWDGHGERPRVEAGASDSKEARLLKAAYPAAVDALKALRTLIDRPIDSDMFRPTIPHTLDEWRAARRVLEADLSEVGFTPTEIAKLLPDGAGGSAHRVRMRARRPRKTKKNAAIRQ